MLPAPHTLLVLVAIAAAAVVLRVSAWRAMLVLRPASIRIRSAESEVPSPEGLSAFAQALASLGFSPIGVRLEHPRFGRPLPSFDFANPRERTFATVHRGRGATRLYLFSPLEDGRFVLTPHAARQASGGYEPQAMAGELEASLHSHRARCGGRERAGTYDAAMRAEAARAWFAGPGAPEIRRQHLPALLWSTATLGMVLWALLIHS